MAAKKGHIGEDKNIEVVIRKRAKSSVLYEIMYGEGRWTSLYTIGEYYNHEEKRQDITRQPPRMDNNFVGGSRRFILRSEDEAWGY